MSDRPDMASAGVEPADKEFIDLSKLAITRERISPVDRSLSKLEAENFARGLPVASAGPDHSLPAPAVESIPLAQPLAPVAPAAPVVVPVAAQAPVSDAYPPRVNDRINKLFGQKQDALANVSRLEQVVADQARRLDALTARESARPPNPYTNQYGTSTGLDPSPSGPPPADHISRAELQAILEQRDRGFVELMALQNQHSAARVEAERDFPDIFGRPDARAIYDQIWTSDPYLQRDPHGPVKAAAMARGFLGSDPRSAPAQPSADVQKQVLSGVGATVAQSSAPAVSQEQRYREALARAASTQKLSDFAHANMIARGLA